MPQSQSNNNTEASLKNSPIAAILKFVVPAVISIGLCWILFHNDSLDDMMAAIRTKCDFTMIGLMVLLVFMSFVFRALRWGIQLRGVGINASFTELLYSIFGTYAVNLVIPRFGEIWRTGYIAHRRGALFGTVFGTMVADRFADLITGMIFTLLTMLVGFRAISAFFHRYPDGYRHLLDIVTSPWTIILTAVIVIAAITFFKSKSSNAMLDKTRNFAMELWTGFSAIVHIKHKGLWMLWTLLLWGCYFGEMVLAFQAFPFTRDILAGHGLAAVLVCFTLGTIAMGIPSNGGIGPYQIAIIFGLSLYCPDGADEATQKAFEMDSKAFANLVLAISTLLTILTGLWAFIAIATGKRKSRQAE